MHMCFTGGWEAEIKIVSNYFTKYLAIFVFGHVIHLNHSQKWLIRFYYAYFCVWNSDFSNGNNNNRHTCQNKLCSPLVKSHWSVGDSLSGRSRATVISLKCNNFVWVGVWQAPGTWELPRFTSSFPPLNWAQCAWPTYCARVLCRSARHAASGYISLCPVSEKSERSRIFVEKEPRLVRISNRWNIKDYIYSIVDIKDYIHSIVD